MSSPSLISLKQINLIPQVFECCVSLLEVEEGDLMRDDLLYLLNAVEMKRDQLNKLALCKELTSEEVVASSRELDKLLNEVYILSNKMKDKK